MHCLGRAAGAHRGRQHQPGRDGGAVTAETGGGSIRVGVAHGPVTASTALGNIDLWKLSQGATAHTGMGKITAEFIFRPARPCTLRNWLLRWGTIRCGVFRGRGSVATLMRSPEAANPAHCQRIFQSWKISNGLHKVWSREACREGAIHGGGPEMICARWSGRSNCVTFDSFKF